MFNVRLIEMSAVLTEYVKEYGLRIYKEKSGCGCTGWRLMRRTVAAQWAATVLVP